jgi:hypothetical protein
MELANLWHESGNEHKAATLANCVRGARLRCRTMPSYRAEYGASAWFLTRQLIGQELRTLYDSPTELSPRLLAVARRLGTIETNPKSKELPTTLVRKLDELEGGHLLRGCNQRVRNLPVSKNRMRER